MNIKKIDSRSVTLIIFSILGVVGVGVYGYFLFSFFKLNESQRDFAGDIKNANTMVAEERMNDEKLRGYFLMDDKKAEFVSGLESICAELGLKCERFGLSEYSDGENIKEFQILVFTTGPFDGVMKLVAYFESAPYPIRISRSQFVKKDPDIVSASSTAEWEGQFDISIPMLKLE